MAQIDLSMPMDQVNKGSPYIHHQYLQLRSPCNGSSLLLAHLNETLGVIIIAGSEEQGKE
jgi:hypothetical protein